MQIKTIAQPDKSWHMATLSKIKTFKDIDWQNIRSKNHMTI